MAKLRALTDKEAYALLYDWRLWARPSQVAPLGEWHVWLVLAGRGWGKTRVAAEWLRAQVRQGARRLALVAETAADARDVLVEGESGILAISPQSERPHYQPSKRRLTWPNGAMAITYSAEDPDQLRGPQHEVAIADEMAKWRYADAAWSNLMFGLRLGTRPRAVVTTTPRPIKPIKDLLAMQGTVTTRGTTYENRANLPPAFFDAIIRRYEGTRLGRQELMAELLADNPHALWTRDAIDTLRVSKHPSLVRVVVGIDPTASATGDEAGIVAAGLGTDDHGYVLDDASLQGSPSTWAIAAIAAYRKLHADRAVAEVNNGGEMVEYTLRTIDPDVSYRAVHASRGKLIRAEPVSALYEQRRVHHVGFFPKLEDEMCDWEPGMPSPNRMDALVWALTDLMLGRSQPVVVA